MELENFDSQHSLEVARKGLEKIEKNDLTSLKAIYRELFEKVIVKVEKEGKLDLEFLIASSSSTFNKSEDTFRISHGMVEIELRR